MGSPLRGLTRMNNPDQRRHAPGLAVAAVREKSILVGDGTKTAAVHGIHAQTSQFNARQLVKVCLPTATRIGLKCLRRFCTSGQKCDPHIVAHFKCRRANRRSQPGDQLGTGEAERAHRRIQNTRGQTAPAAVRNGNAVALTATKQNRQAICGEHRAHVARRARDAGIGLRRRGPFVCLDHGRAMHLI